MALHSHAFLAIVVAAAFCAMTLGQEQIDLQWAICDQDALTVLDKLGEHGKEPYKANNITYYDASPPMYTALGLGLRTKVKKHQPISMVKARFDEEIGNVPIGAGCVWDRYGNSNYFTCGMPAPLEDNQVDWDSLVAYGPFINPKWKLHIEGYKAVFDDVIAEAGDATLHFMEVEVAVDKARGVEVYETVDEHLRAYGVVICEPLQLPKTLRLFATLDAAPRVVSGGRQSVLGSRRVH